MARGDDGAVHSLLTPLEVALTNVIEMGWSESIAGISGIFPNGKLTRGDSRKKTASRYVLDASFSDIEQEGELSFHHPEWLPQNKAPYPMRRILIRGADKSALNMKYQNILEYIEKTYPKILRTTNPKDYDDQYSIFMFDDVGSILIGLKLGEASVDAIRIDVTHTVTRRRHQVAHPDHERNEQGNSPNP